MSRAQSVDHASAYFYQDGFDGELAQDGTAGDSTHNHQQYLDTNAGSLTARDFTTTHATFGPFEPGRWKATFVDNSNPGTDRVGCFVWRRGAAGIAASTATDMIADTRICDIFNDGASPPGLIVTQKSMDFDITKNERYVSFEAFAGTIRVSFCRMSHGESV